VFVGLGTGVRVAVGSEVGVRVAVGGALATTSATAAVLGVTVGGGGVDDGMAGRRVGLGPDGNAKATTRATTVVTSSAALAKAHLGGRARSPMSGKTSASSMPSISARCSPAQPRLASSSATAWLVGSASMARSRQ